MKVFLAVNRVSEIGYRQTTALLIVSLVRLGYEIAVADVSDFLFHGNGRTNRFQVVALAINRSLAQSTENSVGEAFHSKRLEQYVRMTTDRRQLDINDGDVILIRTNPGRDLQRAAIHEAFLHYCCSAIHTGIVVINNPFTTPYFASKSALASVDPVFRPAMMVSNDRQQIVDYIRYSGVHCIVKPLVGSRGRDVIRVAHDDPGIAEVLSSTFAGQNVVAQHFVTSAERGDKRVIVLDGKVLELEGRLAGIQRQPADGDFRANLHTGGTAHPLELSGRQRKAAEHAAQLLHAHGIRLAGVDLIDDKIIEFNVFSTGGLFDCQRFTGLDFSDRIARVLVGKDIE